LALTTDFPKLWKDPETSQRERKRMARLLIEDVTLVKSDQIAIQFWFKGSTARTFTLHLPQLAWTTWQTNPAVIAEIDRLLDEYTYDRIVTLLNKKG
jgi:hypothetical protein